MYLLETRSLVIRVWNGGVENVSVGLDRSTSLSEAFDAAWAIGVPRCVKATCLWQAAQAAVPTNSSRALSTLVGHQPCPRSRCEVSSDASVWSCLWALAGFHSGRAATRTKPRNILCEGPNMCLPLRVGANNKIGEMNRVVAIGPRWTLGRSAEFLSLTSLRVQVVAIRLYPRGGIDQKLK